MIESQKIVQKVANNFLWRISLNSITGLLLDSINPESEKLYIASSTQLRVRFQLKIRQC